LPNFLRLKLKLKQKPNNKATSMARNERLTCKELIEPRLAALGWSWQEQIRIGPGRINLTGDTMYDETQSIIADYLLRYKGAPLAILEAKSELASAADGMNQASRYARRLSLRFSIASNGSDWILMDNDTGDFESLDSPPSPEELLVRMRASVDWSRWEGAFIAGYHMDQESHIVVRPYQDVAINKTLWQFAQGYDRALLLMATGTGKTFTVFQLVWKLLNGKALKREHVLYLTDRNSLKEQAYSAFGAYSASERVQIDKDTVSKGQHSVGKVFFANYQSLAEELDGKKIYEHYDPDFFDLVVIDECHRSGFGDWFGVLEHFGSALQLGLTATPRQVAEGGRVLTDEEKRRDTQHYFGGPVFTYSMKQAIEDGFLVPYLLEERVTSVDESGYTAPDGKRYASAHFERDIRMPARTRAVAEDLWKVLGKYDLRDQKTIVFCVDDTHAAFMVEELCRLSGNNNYAARITRAEHNRHQLERNFAVVGPSDPRVVVTVDLLTTGFDAPDLKNVVFVRPLRSSILYKQMKGLGTRLCEDIDKRYFTIFDYSGASSLEDTEFDGLTANRRKARSSSSKPKKRGSTTPLPIGEGVSVVISTESSYVCLADGRKVPFDEYTEQSREFVLDASHKSIDELLRIWVDKNSRQELREALRDRDIYPSAFRYYLDLQDADDVDILAKIGFQLPRVPSRAERANRLWDEDQLWLLNHLGEAALPENERFKALFWQIALDHYRLFGIDDLELASTYSTPQFAEKFGSFTNLTLRYGSPALLRADLELVKSHLYVLMTA
jgi:type I restriction enzyme R subunit